MKSIILGFLLVILFSITVLCTRQELSLKQKNNPPPSTTIKPTIQEIGIYQLPVGTYLLNQVEFVGFEAPDRSTSAYKYHLSVKNDVTKKYIVKLILPTDINPEKPGSIFEVTGPGAMKVFHN